MTVQVTALLVLFLGLALYILSVLAPKVAWLAPLGLILFGVGLFYWLPGNHAASIR